MKIIYIWTCAQCGHVELCEDWIKEPKWHRMCCPICKEYMNKLGTLLQYIKAMEEETK